MKKVKVLKLMLYALVLFNFSKTFSQSPYELKNGSFETLSAGNANNIYAHFTARRLGPSWYAYKGNPITHYNGYNGVYTCGPCGNGSNYASLKYYNTNGQKKGNSMFMYYPMKSNKTYKLKFDYKKNSGTLYVIATNSATANYNINSNIIEDVGTVNNNSIYSSLPSNDQKLVKKVILNTSSHWSNNSPTGNNTSVNVTFTPTKDYTQLLFVYYSTQATAQGEMYIDGVTMTGDLNEPGKVSMALNGDNSDTNVGIQICSGDPVILDGRGTVDTSLDHNQRIQYFTAIYKIGSNGQAVNGSHTWNDGVPYSDLDLQTQFPLTSPQGVTTQYHVKLAINSGPNNTWIEKVMKVYVIGKPSFYFGTLYTVKPGQTITLKVLGLPQNGQYTYKWYAANTTQILSTNDRLYVTKGAEGNYYYTVEVTDVNTGCTTTKTINVIYSNMKVMDPDLGELTPERNTNIEVTTYPNPVSDIINIKSNTNIDRLELYSLNGTRIATSRGNTIDVKSIKKGMYILKAISGNTTIKESKIIKK
ncbi:T9SS type A sorting domain-containing protein [uncultured Tenacibaculum sp.]|uniref:T9SS type A sorting domain-containing protein n=1 Tax=uncultured Tenacibaculum sp. TaxID=174713 RepID=UPI00262C4575|nr:T9SS type A sorting domain-containing protein [uncultured Tenacibaculum sp.]